MYAEEYIKFIGVRSPSKQYTVTAAEIRRFAEAIGSNNPLHYDEEAAKDSKYGTIIAPATFCLLLKCPEIPGMWLPSSGMIHAGQDFHYCRPIRAGETITCCQQLSEVYEKQGKNGLNVFHISEKLLYDAQGELVCSFKVTLIIKDKLFEQRAMQEKTVESVKETPEFGTVKEFYVGQQLGPVILPPVTRRDIARYAGASGDYNAIHVDDEAAKKMGFPGAIAHGMLSGALQSRVTENWTGEGYEWKDFRFSFRSPVAPGDVLTFRAEVTKADPDGELGMNFRITNQKESEVISGQIEMIRT